MMETQGGKACTSSPVDQGCRLAAASSGAVLAVLLGGLGTIAVALLWIRWLK